MPRGLAPSSASHLPDDALFQRAPTCSAASRRGCCCWPGDAIDTVSLSSESHGSSATWTAGAAWRGGGGMGSGGGAAACCRACERAGGCSSCSSSESQLLVSTVELACPALWRRLALRLADGLACPALWRRLVLRLADGLAPRPVADGPACMSLRGDARLRGATGGRPDWELPATGPNVSTSISSAVRRMDATALG
eukprot:366112-Chlamydomonas_euryale.AAC.15